MLQELYKSIVKRKWCSRSWLIGIVNGYLRNLASRGYSKGTIQHHGCDIIRFSEFIKQHGEHEIAKLPESIERFLPRFKRRYRNISDVRPALNGLVRYLQREGTLPVPKMEPSTAPHAEVISQFIESLIEYRGVCPEYARNVRACCESFAAYLSENGVATLKSIKPQTIFEFITVEGKHYSRRTMSARCSFLRSFLSYLY